TTPKIRGSTLPAEPRPTAHGPAGRGKEERIMADPPPGETRRKKTAALLGRAPSASRTARRSRLHDDALATCTQEGEFEMAQSVALARGVRENRSGLPLRKRAGGHWANMLRS